MTLLVGLSRFRNEVRVTFGGADKGHRSVWRW